MFANIFQPLIDVAEAILRFFHDSMGFSWGWAIVGLTVVVRLVILPLTFKQVRSMQSMQRLQPQMKELQARYKDDRTRMNEELMKLYRDHQVNPLGSCLPLLLQLPFFLSLFYLQQSEGFRALVRDTGASIGAFTGGIVGGGPPDTAAATQITGGEQFLFIPDITKAPEGGVLVALILIYIVTQLGSSTVSAMAMTDKNQKRLMFALPFLFVPFIISFPAGLMVYWITTNTWTIGQQLLIRKVLPPPHLEDKKDSDAADDDGGGGKAKRRGKLATAGAASVVSDSAKQGAAAGASRGRKSRGGTGSGAKGGGAKGAGTKGGGAKGAGTKAGGAKGGSAKGDDANGAGKKTSGDAGNGRPQKAPPPSPRKKKKRSGRRR